MGEALSENERQLALAAWDYDTYARQWGNLVLEAYDALAARVQELEAALRRLVAAMDEPRQTYPVLPFARTEKEAAALVEARAALAPQATEETT